VVVLAHDGAFCDRDGVTNCKGEIIDLARRFKEPIDAIVSGHTHSLVNTDVNGIPVTQARLTGTALAVTDLGPAGSSHHVVDVLTDSIIPDPFIAARVTEAVTRVAPIVNRPVATIERDLNRDGNQYPLGNLIADAMRAVGQSDVAVMNNGGIRTRLRAGPATYGSLFEVMPFANALYRYTITGSALRDYLERLVARKPTVHVSGVVVTYDSTATEGGGARISSVRMANGSALDPNARYTLVLNDFLATGGEGLALGKRALKSEVLPEGDLDALVEYLRARPQPVQAPVDARFVATGAAR
jgi:5'-nucleotidase